MTEGQKISGNKGTVSASKSWGQLSLKSSASTSRLELSGEGRGPI